MKKTDRWAATSGFIETAEDINRLRNLLRRRPRDLLFFELAIGTGLHAKDLLGLTVEDLEGMEPGKELRLERIPKACNRIRTTPAIYRAFANYVRASGIRRGEWLFASQKGGRPLTLVSLSRLISLWFKAAGLPNLGGALTLRRTWAFHFAGDKFRNISQEPVKRFSRPSERQYGSRREEVFRELQREMVSGRIVPGQRIFIENVAQRIGVSAIPVREALAMLEAGGFVHADKKRGYLVNELSESNLREILELRLLLECKAGGLAAMRRREKDLERIEVCHRRYAAARTANDSEALLRSNKEFHHSIYDCAEMPILKSHIDQIWDRVSPYYHIMFRQVEKPNPVVGIGYHQRMIAAIRCRDPREVRRWIRADLTDSTRFVIDLFKIHKKLLERGRDRYETTL